MELWAADHQRKLNKVEEELRRARDEIQRIATQIPVPGSPKTKPLSLEPLQHWRSPVRPSSTSVPTAPTAPPPILTHLALRSPIRLTPDLFTRRPRRPAVPPSSLPSEPPSPLLPTAGGSGGGPPQRPRWPAAPPSSSPPFREEERRHQQKLEKCSRCSQCFRKLY